MRHLECVVFGNSKLTLECINILFDAGQQIVLIITENPSIISWCDENAVAVSDKLPESLLNSDYYFVYIDCKDIRNKDFNNLKVISNDYLTSVKVKPDEFAYHPNLTVCWHYYIQGKAHTYSKSIRIERLLNLEELNHTKLTLALNCFEEMMVAISRESEDTATNYLAQYSTETCLIEKSSFSQLKILSDQLNKNVEEIISLLIYIFSARYFSVNELHLLKFLDQDILYPEYYVGSLLGVDAELLTVDSNKTIEEILVDLAKSPQFLGHAFIDIGPKFNVNLTQLANTPCMQLVRHFFVIKDEVIKFIFPKDTYNAAYIKCFIEALQRFESKLTHNLGQKFSSISLARFDQAGINYSPPSNAYDRLTILELVNTIALKYPKNIALDDLNRKITYEDLEKLSNQFAHYLINEKIPSQTIITLAFPKCVDFFIVMLGVMKANCAYLPIDLEFPQERINYILEDSQSSLVITLHKYVGLFKEQKIPVLSFDKLDLQKINSDPINWQVSANDHAYVIYTSGSTGKPKGVIIRHQGLISLANAQINNFQVHARSKVLQFSSFCFDASVLEWSIALGSGGCLVIADNKQLIGTELINFIEQQQISFIHVPPTTWNMIPPQKFTYLETVVVGGEACPQTLIDKWIGYIKLFNSYGPTENTVCSTLHECDNVHSAATIGKPLKHVKTYVIDPFNLSAPVGVPGELCLAGSGLASGYLHRLELTKEKFVTLPSIDEEKLYRTGDRVRVQDDGTIEYLGRIDNQIKLRGYRVELNEIVKVAESHPAISQAIAVMKGSQENAVLILFYIAVSNHDQNKLEHILRQHLAQHLPVYMLPSFVCSLKEFPMTINGKIDTKKLLSLPLITHTTAQFIPKDDIEQIVYDSFLWTLNLSSLTEEDNFLQWGGNSLRMVHLLSRIEEQLQVAVPISNFFSNPTIKGVIAFIKNNLADHRPSISISRCQRGGPIRLSYAQNRLWFLYELEEKAGLAYNIPVCYRIDGKLDIQKLEKAFNLLVDRHEILRTTFHVSNGQAYQTIMPKYHLELSVIDIEEQSIEKLIFAEIHQLFDITKRPPYAVKLFKINKTAYILTIVQHNILTDGWSIGILLNELSFYYNKLVGKLSEVLPPLDYQYVDYCEWQHNLIESGKINNQIEYWKMQLSGFSELNMPTDFIRPPMMTTVGDSIDYVIDANLTNKLQNLAQERSASLYMVLLAALSLLLHRYSNDDDFIIGTGVASRNHLFLEKILGFFVNTLPLRIQIDTNASFWDFLQNIKNTCVDAYANQDVPFDMIVNALKLTREPDRSPLFQIMFMFQDAGDDAKLDLSETTVQQHPISLKSAMFDLTFNIYKKDNQVLINVQYNTDLYVHRTIMTFLQRLTTLMNNIVENQNCKISALKIITAVEHQVLLSSFNNTNRAFKYDNLTALLLNRLGEFKSTIALKYQELSPTYSELDQRSNQLARKLLAESKVNSLQNQPIILLLSKDIDYVISLLAILKLGSHYIPIDPSYPEDRVRLIIEDTNSKYLICDLDKYDKLIRDLKLKKFTSSHYQKYAAAPLSISRSPDDVAYIIYTSGSTGKPKGVCVTDKNICNMLQSFQEILNFKPENSFLSVTMPTFDIFVLELYLPLISGGTCILTPPSLLADQSEMVKYIDSFPVDFIQATPSLWGLLINNLRGDYSKTQLLTGGESLNQGLAQKMLNKFQKVYQVYGPTETTVWSTIHPLNKAEEADIIGKPIANTYCYIVDKFGDLLPNQVPGELAIGGMGVAKEYLNQHDLTNDKFITNPFLEDDRLYKTGDIVWRDESGLLHYVNRADHQVKVRGFRVELEEIESVFMSHDLVKTAVAISPIDANGQRTQILMFYTLNTSDVSMILSAKLENFLTNKLPNYMLPNQYIKLQQFPLTHNGKINRNALHVRAAGRDALDDQYIAPKTTLEKQIAEILSKVLNHDDIGCEDNFFVIGGHSLLVPQVVIMLNESFQIDLTIREFIQNPSISRLIKHFNTKSAKKIHRELNVTPA